MGKDGVKVKLVGAGRWVCPYFFGVGWYAFRRCPAPPRAYPACLLRSHAPPFVGDERGREVGRSLSTSFLTGTRHSCIGRNPLPLSFSTKGARTE